MSAKQNCRCPYCEGPQVPPEIPCVPCGVKVDYCPKCGQALPKGASECPACAGPAPAPKGNEP